MIDWLLGNGEGEDREKAIEIARTFMSGGYIHHCKRTKGNLMIRIWYINMNINMNMDMNMNINKNMNMNMNINMNINMNMIYEYKYEYKYKYKY